MQGETPGASTPGMRTERDAGGRARPMTAFLSHSSSWLVRLRWIACACLFFVIWLTSDVLGVVDEPRPLYLAGLFLTAYNLVFWLISRRKSLERNAGDQTITVMLQITLDLVVLSVLLYYSDIAHNPFSIYFVFHIIIAGILLPKLFAYLEAGLATVLVGALLYLQYRGLVPSHSLTLPFAAGGGGDEGVYLAGLFIALSSALFFSVYFTVSVLKNVRAAEASLRQREKFSSLGQFVSGIVHQIRNPLDGLRNCLRHIGSENAGNSSCAAFIKLMGNELDRMERLTFRLQDFARPHGMEIQSVEVNREVEAALGLIGIRSDERVDLHLELGEVSQARGDPFALQEVVINLYNNAVAAMPEGGRLVLRTRSLSRRIAYAAHAVVIEVTDTGPGLSPAETELIFEPFYTTRPAGEGTGLGLWICQTLVSQMGGLIEVESARGQGSTFRVLLQAE